MERGTEMAAVLPVEIARNCNRCGRGFWAEGPARVCPACRPLKVRKSIDITRPLSFREKQVVALVAQGKLNKEIAYTLCLTEATVKDYMHRILRKTGTPNRTALAVWACRQEAERAQQP